MGMQPNKANLFSAYLSRVPSVKHCVKIALKITDSSVDVLVGTVSFCIFLLAGEEECPCCPGILARW